MNFLKNIGVDFGKEGRGFHRHYTKFMKISGSLLIFEGIRYTPSPAPIAHLYLILRFRKTESFNGIRLFFLFKSKKVNKIGFNEIFCQQIVVRKGIDFSFNSVSKVTKLLNELNRIKHTSDREKQRDPESIKYLPKANSLIVGFDGLLYVGVIHSLFDFLCKYKIRFEAQNVTQNDSKL